MTIQRRARKRPAAVQRQDEPRIPRRILVVIQTTGKVRCPRKWSEMGMEACAGIQERDAGGCIVERCAFFGFGAVFQAEATKAKTPTVAPKPVPAAKLRQVADAFDAGAGDFSGADDGLQD